jgi:hypothetical protein
MHVYSADTTDLGHVVDSFEDSFLIHKGFLFPTNRYLPYSAIISIEDNRIQLSMTKDEVMEKEWEKRPDYEHHLGDPTQLFYDRGHEVHDPFDKS